ncbi:MAG: TetR/AcrR family transcriptional regulator [Acutalibacteraceae bacterium]|nr:TetR/AcrR family transcriptional regulator [Acutalibacteraceae bacterium]
MTSKNSKNTKSKIVSSAWKLFYEQGYDDTTVDEIIKESGTSKGSFYHYFDSKDALLGSLAYLFDEKYEELQNEINENTHSIDILLFLNRQLFEMIENTVDLELIKRLYSTQLITRTEKQLLDHNRVYYKLLRKIVLLGQQNGEITKNQSANDIVKYYAFCERAIIYDWCLCNGDYSLSDSASNLLPFFLSRIANQ